MTTTEHDSMTPEASGTVEADSTPEATHGPDFNMTRLRGALPPRPASFARTPVVARIANTVEIAVRCHGVGLVSGPVGVGKSTAVAEAGRHLDTTVVYVLMQDAPSVKASLEVIWESMTRTAALGTEKQIKDQILV